MNKDNTRKSFCPQCACETQADVIRKMTTIVFRNESFEVEEEFLRCRECGHEFDDFQHELEPINEVYRLYRERHGYVKPEEILAFRKQHDLTQKDVAELLGFGAVTLSRYENGALQDEAHDRLLRLMIDPHGLQALLKLPTSSNLPSKLRKLMKTAHLAG